MMNAIRASSRRILSRNSIWIGLFSLTVASGFAAAQEPVTPLDKQLSRIEFGVNAIGTITPSTSGTSLLPQAVTQRPSNTVGFLVDLSYTKSKWFGLQFNFTQARFSENFTVTNIPGTFPPPRPQNADYSLDIQSKVNEYSLGYMVHPREIFGLQPFVGGGVGLTEFRPTPGGGQGQQVEDRTTYFYALGVQKMLFGSNHFGARLQLRQTFYGAPDFNANYFATGAHTFTTEPGFGFFLRF